MLNITSAETLFSGIGISVVFLGFLCCLLRSRIRFGILSLLLGNIFLWSAIVFPKKATDLMFQYGLDDSFFAKNELYHGIAAGVVIFAVWYFIRSAFVSLMDKVFKKNETKQSSKDHSQKSDLNENETQKSISEPNFENKAPLPESRLENKSSGRVEPSFGNEEKANPHLFDNLRLNR